MKQGIEWQVCSRELSEKLRDLGVPQESMFSWDLQDDPPLVYPTDDLGDETRLAAFTVAELGEMLPWGYTTLKHISGDFVGVKTRVGNSPEYIDIKEPNEADARAKILIYLLEHGLIKADPQPTKEE